MRLDLTWAEGISFDFRCPDFSPFQQLNCYLKSGDGWYAYIMNPDERSEVQRIVLRKRDVKWKEGKVAGWNDISSVRIFGYRGNPLKASFAAGNFSAFNELKQKPGERRLIWCHSPWGLGWKDAGWGESARMIRAAGFSDVIASVAWANGACYKSKVLPPSPQFAFRKEDAFDLCRDACRTNGLKFHAWMVCFNMGSHCSDATKKELAVAGRVQVGRDGKPNANWLCPSHPENARQVVKALVELASKGADGVHLDYIRYPDGDFCHCGRCESMSAKFPSWRDFRAAMITQVVKAASDAIHKDFPGVEVSAAVRNTIGDASVAAVGQDWTAWCRDGLLDFVCPMDYFPLESSFTSLIGHQKTQVCGVRLYPGIGDINLWPDKSLDASRIVSHVKAVRSAGLDGFCFFDFGKRTLEAFGEIGWK